MESGNCAVLVGVRASVIMSYNIPLSNFLPSGLIVSIEKMSSKTMLDVNEAMDGAEQQNYGERKGAKCKRDNPRRKMQF